MTQQSCCKCQSNITIQSSSNRHSIWCRQCFIDQLHIKFFQAIKVAKEYCRPPPSSSIEKGKNKSNTKYLHQHHTNNNNNNRASSSLAIHFENNLNSFVTLHLIKNYLKTNQVRSNDKWKSPIDFNDILVVWVNPGSAIKYLSTTSSVSYSEPLQPFDKIEDEEIKIRSIVESLGFKLVVLNLDDIFISSSFKSSSHLAEATSEPNSKCFIDLSNPNLPILKISTSTDSSNIIINGKNKILVNEQEANKNIDYSKNTSLQNLLKPLTKTSKKSLIELLTLVTLLNFCKKIDSNVGNYIQNNNNKVLIKTTSSTRLAIDTLLNVSLGNGFCLDQIVGPSSYINDVLICRPIYQILDIELIEYSKLMKLPDHYNSHHLSSNSQSVVDNLTNVNSLKKMDNIASLITDFINKLEENYPLTSSVINQTVNKIGKNKSSNDIKSTLNPARTSCRMCLRVLDSQANQWKRSITLSSHEPQKTTSAGENQGETKVDETSRTRNDESKLEPDEQVAPANENDYLRKKIEEGESLQDDLCFGCLVTLTDHLYSFNPVNHAHHRTPSDLDHWTQLPDYLFTPSPLLDTPSTVTQQDYLSSVLDEFLLKH